MFDQFMYDVIWHYRLINVERSDFFKAANLTRNYSLKAYDAIHLAVALRHNNELKQYNNNISLTFVSGDRALLTAAQAEGLVTDNPFDHVSPQDTV